MIIAADIVTRIGEMDILGTYDAATWDTPKLKVSERAMRAHTESAWGDVYLDAMACWALHHLTVLSETAALAAGGLVVGPVAGIRTGDTSIQFLSTTTRGTTDSSIYWQRTTWGQQYITYRDTRPDAHLFLTGC
jgi:hypothetical protein